MFGHDSPVPHLLDEGMLHLPGSGTLGWALTPAGRVENERLLGIRLGDDQVRRGKEFVQGVVDRAGEAELNRLLELPGSMPTPAEVDAPGLWIARVGG